MRTLKVLAIAAVLGVSSLLDASPGEAQRALEPEEVVMRYMESLMAGDYAGAAAWLHPDELRKLRDVFQSLFAADPDEEGMSQIFLVRDSAEFARLPPEKVAARFLEFSAGEMIAYLEVETMEVTGRLPSDDSDVVLIQTRITLTADPDDDFDLGPIEDIVWLRKQAAEWRVIFRPGMMELFLAMPSSVSEEPVAYDGPQMDEEPEAFALRYAEALMRRDHAGLAAIMHRDELREIRDLSRSILAADRTRNLAPEIFLVRDSTEFLLLSPEEVGARVLRLTIPHDDFEIEGVVEGMRVHTLERWPTGDPDIVVVGFQVSFSELADTPGFPPREEFVSLRVRRQGTEWRAMFNIEMLVPLYDLADRSRPLSRPIVDARFFATSLTSGTAIPVSCRFRATG